MNFATVLAIVLLIGLLSVDAREISITPSTPNWQSSFQGLQAGDVVTFSEGTYLETGRFGLTLPGTINNPIIIQGAPGARVVIKGLADHSRNALDIDSGSYFAIRNLEFIDGSKGIACGTGVSHGVFEHLSIHDVPETAFTANTGGTYTNLTIRYVEAYNTGTNTGECFYLGCSGASCIIHDSLIEFNYCHNTTLATGGSLGSGIQVKTGSYNNIIRNNVCKDLRGPCVLVYDDYDNGVNIIEGNVALGTGDNGIQATAGAIIRNNIVYGASGDGIAIINNSVKPGSQIRNVQIIQNTVVNSGGGALRPTNFGSTGFLIANNAFFGNTIIAGGTSMATVPWYKNGVSSTVSTAPAGQTILLGSAATELGNPSAWNFYPQSTSKLINAGDGTSGRSVAYDFNGTPRSTTTPTIGAYEYTTATNPGWTVTGGFKVMVNNVPTTTTASSSTTGSSSNPTTSSSSSATTSNPTTTSGDTSATSHAAVTSVQWVLLSLSLLLALW